MKALTLKEKNYTLDSIKIDTPITKCFWESNLLWGLKKQF